MNPRETLVSRRRMLGALGAGAGAGLAVLGLPRIAYAAAPTENRLIVVMLRGALDGLAAVPPYGDARQSEHGKAGPGAEGAQDAAAADEGFARAHGGHRRWKAGLASSMASAVGRLSARAITRRWSGSIVSPSTASASATGSTSSPVWSA